MHLPRKYRILTTLLALFGMLFMQLAVAAYACPALGPSHDTAAGTTSQAPMQSMPGCDEADPGNPALCQAHCQDAKASLDKPEVPAIAQAAAIVSAILAPLDPSRPVLLPGIAPDWLLQRITSPPISIRHCCLRI